jgi:hypothetical protein
MDKEKALQILKQTLDNAIKMGIAPNLETTQIISQAFSIIKDLISGNTNNN